MRGLLLDAGALVAIDRNQRSMIARLRVAQMHSLELRSNGAVLAQVWRDPNGKQASLAAALKSIDVIAVDSALGRRAGVLMGKAGTRDAVDASLVAMARSGDRILTDDITDFRALVEAADAGVIVAGD